MHPNYKTLFIVLVALFLTACASAPTWEGMSESEISAWKGINVDVASAQKFRSAGLTSTAVGEWQSAGLSGTQAILDWNKGGYSPATGAPWIEKGFDLKTAQAWTADKFTAEEARTWMDADFTLKEAVKNRKMGLTPVR